MLKITLIGSVFLALLAGTASAAPPAEAPKLVMNLVSIPETKTHIFVVGSTGFNSVASLKKFLGEQPAGTVVEWNPGCLRVGGELLSSFEKELNEFKSYLEKRKIKFVQIPSG